MACLKMSYRTRRLSQKILEVSQQRLREILASAMKFFLPRDIFPRIVKDLISPCPSRKLPACNRIALSSDEPTQGLCRVGDRWAFVTEPYGAAVLLCRIVRDSRTSPQGSRVPPRMKGLDPQLSKKSPDALNSSQLNRLLKGSWLPGRHRHA